jgi:Na+/H+ antiporter NhaD/arsenite permease-like protein
MLAAGVILVITYVGIAFTRLPRVNIDRPAAALLGAILMILAGVLTFQEAVSAIDFNTLALLFGMMCLVAVLKRGGFFTLLAARSLAVAHTPNRLMVTVVVATSVCSAILVNDVVVLLFTPVVIQACRTQRVNPVPYLIAEAMASNIGSTATIVGNPQNMLIGVTSGVSFARFFAHLAPVAAVATLILLLVLWVLYRNRIALPGLPVPQQPRETAPDGETPDLLAAATPVDRGSLLRSIPVLAAATVAFFVSSSLGLSIPMIALTAGVAAIVISGIKPSDVMRDVDWVLLAFFGGLFVVIGGARQAGLLDAALNHVNLAATTWGIASLHLFSGAVSQLVSNVPLTLLLLPLLKTVPGDTLWLSLAAGATLGGNATLIGAVANIIVAEQAYRDGVVVGFWEFCKVGVVVTTLTVGASIGILLLEFELGFLR